MKRIPVFVAILSLPLLMAFEDPIDKLLEGFRRYLKELPQEKVYLHLDRPSYVSGETIWFKAYVTAGPHHLPSQLSRTIYVEFINHDGSLLKQSRLYSVNGSATGDIVLPDSLASGNYVMRAYTNWMKNSDEDYFFHRPIKILSTRVLKDAAPSDRKALDVQFFPEGGDLVNGIQSKVAFKALGSDGFGKSIKGKLVDDSGKVISAFESNFLGMGTFPLVPEAGKTYRALIENPAMEFNLPSAKENGLVMSVRNSKDLGDIILRLQTTDHNSLKTVYILAQSRGLVCYAGRIEFPANVLTTKIPKAKFPGGVAQITIADEAGAPLAERLVFVPEKDQVSFKITSSKTTYAHRELIKLDIEARDSFGPVVADLSLAVSDDKQILRDEHHETINTYLLLSSELRGNIESPGYYFGGEDPAREQALDNLLLTQGWRRFSLKKAMEDAWPAPVYRIEKGLTVRGRLLGDMNKKGVAEGQVTMVITGDVKDTRTTQTDLEGNFQMDDLVYFNPDGALLQGQTKKGNTYVRFEIDSTREFPAFKFQLPNRYEQVADENAFVAASLERRNLEGAYELDEKTILLNEVEVRGERDLWKSTENLYGSATIHKQVAGNPFLENYDHPLQIIQGRVAGVYVMHRGAGWTVSMQGVGSFTSMPLIMVDNMVVDADMLTSFSGRDIGSYKIWKPVDATIFGARGANGVISFYTRKGRQPERVTANGVARFNQPGYQLEREFYAPKYSENKPAHAMPDRRVTLFWAPLIKTDAEGHASVSFYNHDLETTATATIEGLASNGKAGVGSLKYEIKKK